MRPDLSERPTVTPADLKVVVRPLVNHLHPTEVPLRYRLNSRLVGGVKANLGVCQDGRHPKFKYRRTVSPSVRVVTNTPPDCGADRQNLLHHTLRDRVGGSHRRSWAAASFAIVQNCTGRGKKNEWVAKSLRTFIPGGIFKY